MISSIVEFISAIEKDLANWDDRTTPWFRGESNTDQPLQPKVANLSAEQENHLLQSFRRRSGSLRNTPGRNETDKWIFLAQHYGIPTRLLDWSEGALFSLFFAINNKLPSPKVYMLNPHVLNSLALESTPDYLNFPMSWASPDNPKPGYENIALAWELRNLNKGFDLPIALEPTYQDTRMIAQRSAFTVHGKELGSILDILNAKNIQVTDCLHVYDINQESVDQMLIQLAYLGITHASIFPDLDHLSKDISASIYNT